MIHSQLTDFYTPVSEIYSELEKRSKDVILQQKVKEFLGDYLCKEIAEGRSGVLSRCVVTPNIELQYFLDLTQLLDLSPLLLEYDTKFVAKNINNYHLCKMSFFEPLKKSPYLEIKNIKIVNFNTNEGKKLSSIKTLNDENLYDYHHRMLYHYHPELKDKVINITDWFNKIRQASPYYYLYYLAHFLCSNVLFENFLLNDKEEKQFFIEKELPSFEKVYEHFGIKPLIVPLLPFENEHSNTWVHYPMHYYEHVKKEFLG